MPVSPYIQAIRERIGHSLLLLPGVTAVIRREGRFLLARQRDSGLWSLIGGGVEPGEEPEHALRREVREEIGATVSVRGIVGAYGGPALMNTYPNGDEVGYVTVAYDCELEGGVRTLEEQELIEVGWWTRSEVDDLPRHRWIDRVLEDASFRRSGPASPAN